MIFDQEITTKDQAIEVFRELVAQHGLMWTSKNVPKEHWDLLAQANKFLTTEDRRAAVGLNPS